MSGRDAIFFIARAIDRSGLPALCRRLFAGLYTLYRAKDLGAFGRGSSIEPFSSFQGPENIHIGSGTHILMGCRLQAEPLYASAVDGTATKPLLRIGDGTLIGRYCHITARGHLEIGRRVLLGERILIADHDHGYDDVSRAPKEQPLTAPRDVAIGDGCWIGDGAAILAGTVLGPNVVVGANAVVRGTVPAFTVVAGNPARPVRRYDEKLGRWVEITREGGG